MRKPGDKGGRSVSARCIVGELKWTDADFAAASTGQLPMGKPRRRMVLRRRRCRVQERRARARRNVRRRPTSAIRPSSRAARWPTGRTASSSCTARHAEHRADRRGRGPAGSAPIPRNVVIISEYTGGGFGSKITSDLCAGDSGAAAKKTNAPVLMRISREEEHYMGGARPAIHRPGEGRLRQGRPPHRARSLRHHRQRTVRIAG